jgi:hypothetical protein
MLHTVGEEGLEPSSLAALAPKASAYTNSATRPSDCISGPPRGIRTPDRSVKSRLLYQLSYGRIATV